MGKFISCGQCDKRYIKILCFSFGINILAAALIYIFIYITLIYLRFVTGVSLLKPLITYIGMTLCFIPELILKNKTKKNTDKNKISTNRMTGFIKYIYTDLSDKMKLKDYFHVGFFSLVLLLIDFIKIYLEKKENCDDAQYYFTELPVLLLISIYLYKLNFYRHQYVSIIFITISGFIQYVIKINYYYKSISDFKDIIIDLFFKY